MKKWLTVVTLVLMSVIGVLFAGCTSNKVELSFEVNGGVEINSVELEKGESYTLPVPEKDGFEFLGWYLSEDFSGTVVVEVTASENATYYAKWEQLYTVKFETAGGTLASSSLQLKQGDNLYDAVKEYIPVKTDYQFDAWMNGTELLASNAKMPASDVTLTARYKVKYTIELYKETEDGSGYEKDEYTETGYGYVDELTTAQLSSSEQIVGFMATANENAVTSLKLSAQASENVFKLYFERRTFNIVFHANYPDGSDEIIEKQVRYGASVEIPSDLKSDGNCLIGWATSVSGDVLYPVDAVSDNLYNASVSVPMENTESFLPSSNTVLFAVWEKGYTDMLGGDDAIFLFEEQSKVAYLCRNGVYFEGEYNAASGRVIFSDDSVELFFECKLLDSGMFIYYSDVRSVETYDYYGVRLVNGQATPYVSSATQLHFDGFDGITYTVTGADGMTTSSNGTFTVDENGFYVATFTDGDLTGETLTIWLTSMPVNGVTTPVFRVQNELETSLGEIHRTAIYRSQLTYYTTNYVVTFTGFGIASVTIGTSTNNYYCFIENDILTLSGTDETYFQAKLCKVGDAICYSIYFEEVDLTAKNGNSVLVLDGYGVGTYRAGATNVSGYYEVAQSGFGDYIVTLHVNGAEYADFIITNTAEEGAEPQYTLTEKPVGYAEYCYTDEKLIYPSTYLVLNDESEGTASIYCSDENGNIVKVSTGTYQAVEGLYVYNKTTWNVPEGVTVPFKSTDFNSFLFTLGSRRTSSGTTYAVNYWTEYAGENGTEKLYTEYVCGEDTLFLLNFDRIAMYRRAGDAEYTIGSYSLNSRTGVLTMTGSSSYLYFVLDEESKTYERLAFAPYSLQGLTLTLEIDETIALTFSGRVTENNALLATYSYLDGEEQINIAGTVTSGTGNIYTFRSDDGSTTFQFKMLSTSSASYFAKYDATYAGRYMSDNGVLTLDGYGASATYNGIEGMYIVAATNVIVVVHEDGNVYFDVNAIDKTFTVRGSEYGTYLFFDNQNFNGYYFAFDGYGKLSVFETVSDGNGGYNVQYIDEEGAYEIDGDIVTVIYSNETNRVTLIGRFGSVEISGTVYNTFSVRYEETEHVFINQADWSVLKLDGSGNAVKYGQDGVKENGTYIIVSDSLFYYVNEGNSDAAIYRYNVATGIATPLKLRARGYYTSDMESLLFSQYGFAIFNGSTRYYYNVERDQVTIYRRAEEGETGANEYGFIRQEFGKFSDTIEFDGKTYYYNEGYNITFNRTATDASKYPLPVNFGTEEQPLYCSLESVIFTPSGSDEAYSVNGIAYINGTQYQCTVSRAIDDDGEVHYFVTISSYRFEVALRYGGMVEDEDGIEVSASTFTVTGLSGISSMYSDTYLTTFYIIYSWFGMSIPNDWGMVQFVSEYDEDGKLANQYLNAAFGESSNMYDANGELMALNQIAYEYDEETGLYIARFKYDDGYTYEIAIGLTSNQYFRMVAYQIAYCVRLETVKSGDYTLEIETLIASDLHAASNIGAIFGMTLYQGETEIEFSGAANAEDGLYYITRTLDGDGKIIATEYYLLKLTRGETESSSVPPFTALTVEKLESVETIYDRNGTSYIDVDTVNHKVLFVYIYDAETEAGMGYSVTACEYDGETDTYSVTLASGVKYTAKVEDGTVVLTEVFDEDTPSDTEEE